MRVPTPLYEQTVAQWITSSGEVLVILRYLRSAGARDYILCQSFDDFRQIMERCPLGTDMIVFREKALPLRGIVTDRFIEEALTLIPEEAEYLIVERNPSSDSPYRKMSSEGQSQADLRADLLDWFGKEVAFGPLPDFTVADHEGMISASKGGIDGPR